MSPNANFSPISEVLRVLELEGKSILDCAKKLRGPQGGTAIGKAVEHLRGCLDQGGKIIVLGVGKSGKVAQKIASTLCSTGSLAVFLHPTEGLHGDLGLVRKGDAVLALSYTGNTEELVRLLPSIQAQGIPIVALGGNSQSKLAALSDVWIDASVESEACPNNLAPTASTTLALALGDALALALMQLRGFDAQAFALNHPGGSLGRRLNLKVSEVMHQGDELALVGPETPMDEVAMALTRKNLGMALVVEGPRLLGIIVDGDFRRALRQKDRFFTLKAKDLMNRQPIVAAPGMMAQSALELMENRPTQISALPVVDEKGDWKGIIRLHDLVQTF